MQSSFAAMFSAAPGDSMCQLCSWPLVLNTPWLVHEGMSRKVSVACAGCQCAMQPRAATCAALRPALHALTNGKVMGRGKVQVCEQWVTQQKHLPEYPEQRTSTRRETATDRTQTAGQRPPRQRAPATPPSRGSARQTSTSVSSRVRAQTSHITDPGASLSLGCEHNSRQGQTAMDCGCVAHTETC